jgi:hypothetical protein
LLVPNEIKPLEHGELAVNGLEAISKDVVDAKDSCV